MAYYDPAACCGEAISALIAAIGADRARALRQCLQPLDLGPRQYAVMRAVAAEQGRSQQAIGQALDIPASRIVMLVDSLQERGLLERYPNPTDRRAHALRLTRAGQRLLTRARPVAERHERCIGASLTDRERAQLVRLLARVAGEDER